MSEPTNVVDAVNSIPEGGFRADALGVFQAVRPAKDRLVHHPVWQQLAEGAFPLANYRKMLIHFYPLVENFPKFMGLALAKTRTHLPGHDDAKKWLIDNIKVEQNHALWFHDWASGIGIDTPALTHVRPEPAIDAIVNYLWSINERGTLAESLVATNIGIEWATGEWSQNVVRGAETYFDGQWSEKARRRSMAWLRAHARYDDTHPYEAMELVMRCAQDQSDVARALRAAERSLDFYTMGLDACLNA